MKKLTLAVMVVVSFAVPAQAHEAEPLPAVPSWMVAHWRQEWAIRAAPALTLELLGEWRWMRDTYWSTPERRSSPQASRKVQERQNPAPTSRTAYPPGVEQWRNLVASYFPADQVDRTLRVMACESGGDPNAYNPSGASGLMQALASWADNFGYQPTDLFDPDINLYVASLLYYDGGWAHWVCR